MKPRLPAEFHVGAVGQHAFAVRSDRKTLGNAAALCGRLEPGHGDPSALTRHKPAQQRQRRRFGSAPAALD
jgi:hypothetical protein